MAHDPVMVAETIAALVGDRGGRYVDGTVGEGGHARAILAALGPEGRLLGADRDPAALSAAAAALESYGARVRVIHACFGDLAERLTEIGWRPLDGVLLDLGLRSTALDDPARGFSFRRDGPLDMRFDPAQEQTAERVLQRIAADRLERILEAGTSRAGPRAITRAILAGRRRRSLRSTADLVRCLRAGLGRRATPKLISSVFAALRMEVNQELEELERALVTLPGLLKVGGVLCVLSYQSQEDRRVKHLGRAHLADPDDGQPFRMVALWARPLRPSAAEASRNSRARSARLRAFRRSPAENPT